MKDIIGTAAAAIRSSRLRSTLTVAIIAVGIMSLVGIQTAVEALSRELSDSFGRMGAGMQLVESLDDAPPVSFRQASEFREIFPSSSICTTVADITEAASGGVRTDPVVTVLASDINYLKCNGLQLESGRMFTQREELRRAPVCIVGKGVAERLFGKGAADGCGISFGYGNFRVVGTLEKRGAMFGGGSDYSIVVPLGSTGSNAVNHTITFISDGDATDTEEAVMRRIRGIRQGDDGDFSIKGGDSAASTLAGLKSKLSLAALAIGLVTILGASVGLMNTMLVSVKERKTETGLRKAVGARNSDIRNQFLAEAVILGLEGGTAGVLLGLAAGGCVALSLGASFVVPWDWTGIALAICILVGTASGLLPARKAASLPPADAIREQ